MAVIVSASLAQIETAALVLSKMLPPIGLAILLLDILFAVLFSRWFTAPVRKLSAGAREMADGNYDIQVDVRRRDELGLLAAEFNHMADEVKRSAQLERDLLANVSHDLRTPADPDQGLCRDGAGHHRRRRRPPHRAVQHHCGRDRPPVGAGEQRHGAEQGFQRRRKAQSGHL